MNIAIVTPEFVSEKVFDGGLANYTYKLAKWLISNGHNVVVYLSTTSEIDNRNFLYENIYIKRISTKDYAWHLNYQLSRLKLGFLFSERNRYKIRFWQIAKAVNKEILSDHKHKPIDIIHYPHLGGFAYCRPRIIPSIVRISSSTDLCRKMGGYGSSDLQIDVQIDFEMAAMRRADKIFGPSKMIAALTEPIIGKKITIVETPYLPPSEELNYDYYTSKLKGKSYILFFGSIGLIKGVGTIAQIIYELLERNTELYYVFVGKQLNNKIEGVDLWDHLLSSAGNYSDRVLHIHSLKHAELFPVIKGALMVTLPSRTDNFPNTCIESMANGKIVIGTKGNGFDQLIEDGISGFTIDVDDHLDLLNKIEFVLNLSVDAKREIETKAIERIDSLKPDIVLNQLLELYMDTIKNHKN
jgi:glycosyltransferase involved in cell wall biosynthesis